jgi:hypothetical protein
MADRATYPGPRPKVTGGKRGWPKGKPRGPKSATTRARISAAQRARWADPEVRARISAAKADPEVRARMSAAQRARWADPEVVEAAVERARSVSQLYADLGTLQAVGDRLGITRERVRQILNQAARYGVAVRTTAERNAEQHAKHEARIAITRAGTRLARQAREDEWHSRLIFVCRRLGYVPSGKWLIRNERNLYAWMGRNGGVRALLDRVAVDTGLPRQPHGNSGKTRPRRRLRTTREAAA